MHVVASFPGPGMGDYSTVMFNAARVILGSQS